jgi:hypothetical protein
MERKVDRISYDTQEVNNILLGKKNDSTFLRLEDQGNTREHWKTELNLNNYNDRLADRVVNIIY